MTQFYDKATFLINTGLTKVQTATSQFKTKISNVIYNILGNISLKVYSEYIQSLPTAAAVTYQIRIIEDGRLDKNLNTNLETTRTLGTGQISYTDKMTFLGKYTPPKFVISDNSYDIPPTGTPYETFGLDNTISRFISAICNNTYDVTKIIICDRNKESFFVAFTDATSVTNSYLTTFSKLENTDSNALSRKVVTDFRIDCMVKIEDNRFLICYLNTTSYRTIKFKILDENGDVVYTLNDFNITDIGIINPNILDMDFISDGKGNIYGAYTYYFTGGLPTVRFIISNDSGRSWKNVYIPGTDVYLNIGNPLANDVFDPNNVNGGRGYWRPRLSYDNVNQIFILTVMGHRHNTTSNITDVRFVTLYSKDFMKWDVLNYPIFKTNCAGLGIGDYSTTGALLLDEVFGTRLVRYKDKYFAISADLRYLTKTYACIFPNETEKYGSRLGPLWYLTGDVGYSLKNFDYKVLDDDVIYLVSINNNESGSYTYGYVVQAIGSLSNLPDKDYYDYAWFGSVKEPIYSGWTQSGSSIESMDNDGWHINSIAVNTYYEQSFSASEICVKFIIKPMTAGAGSADTSQGISFTTQNGVNYYGAEIRVGTTSIYAKDLYGAATASAAVTINDFFEILVVFKNSYNMSVFYRKLTTYETKWMFGFDMNNLTVTAAPTFTGLRFGNVVVPTAASYAIWKAIYYRKYLAKTNVDIYVEDKLIEADPSTNYDVYLDPIPMRYVDDKTYQKTYDRIYLLWSGLDAHKGDTYSFTVDSMFGISNIVNKSPNLVYRTDVTNVTQDIDFSSTENNFSSFLYNTTIIYNINFKRCSLYYGNTSPISLLTTIDSTIDTGTFAATSERQSEDRLIVRCTGKTWLIGEFVNKYVMLQRLYEPHKTNPALDNSYRNVGFRILDNGKDYLVLSTKGLLADELHVPSVPASYNPMRVVSGEAFVIYDNKLSFAETTLRNYVYTRIRIIASSSYSTAWNVNNQPSLPNERSWQLGELDFGVRTDISEDANSPFAITINSNTEYSQNDKGQTDYLRKGEYLKTFDVKLNLSNDVNTKRFISLYNAMNETEKPFWFMPNPAQTSREIYLVTVDTDLTTEMILPDYHQISIILKEVK